MSIYNIGDIVVRKSYNQDIYFRIIDILDRGSGNTVYVLRGMFYRIEADASGDDLLKKEFRDVRSEIQLDLMRAKGNTFRGSVLHRIFLLNRLRRRTGRILHVDSSERFLNICTNHYREAGLRSIGILSDESKQPEIVKRALEESRPDILVITGHDGIRKSCGNLQSLDNYRNSRYFIQCVKYARSYEANLDKLCIFAGACQSYYEGIMEAGANFASSPGRININALDPAIVSEKVALTDRRYFITPQEITRITITGAKGIGGVPTRGHMYD